MTTLETITRELDRITRERSIDSFPCYAHISMEIHIGCGRGAGVPEFEVTVADNGSTVAMGRGASLSAAWQAFQDDFNAPRDPKSLIRQADAEMGPDQASELRRQVAEKSHPKAGLWNLPSQSRCCYAISPGGECYFVDSHGNVDPYEGLTPDDLLRCTVPNTWPIPEAAKPGLRALGVPFDDAPTRPLGKDAIAIEQAEMEAALSRPDRFEQE